jgi:hypothetical protein
VNYIEALEQLIAAGETEFESMNALKDRIKELTGKRPGGSFQRNQADYKRLLSQFTFKKFVEKAAKTDLSKFTLTNSLAKKVKDLNALHKGVYFQVETSTNGYPYLRVRFNPGIKLANIDKMGDIGPPTEKTFNSFKKIIDNVVSTPEYIKYNKPTLERADINRIKRQAERARKIADPTDIYKSIQQLKLQISKDMGFGPIASEVHVHHGAIKTAKTNLNNMAFIFGKELNNADDMKALEVELAKLNSTTKRLLKNKPDGYKELIREQNLAKRAILNKYSGTPIAGLSEATEVVFGANDKPIFKRLKMDLSTTIGEGSRTGEIDFKTVTPKQRTKILDVAGENFTKQLKAYVSTLDKKSPEFKQICTLTAASGGTAASCIKRIDQEPIKVAENIVKTEEPIGKLGAFKNAANSFLNLAKRGGKYGAIAAAGAATAGLVKTFMNDDPTTYLSNEDQQKNMLISMITNPIDETPEESPEILDWQLPTLGAITAAGMVPGGAETYKARRAIRPDKFIGPMEKGVGPVRAALGLKGVLGKGLAATATPLGLLALEPLHLAGQIQSGDSLTDIATNPLNYMGPAFASGLTKEATRFTTPMVSKIMRMGMSPTALRGLSRFGGYGLAASLGIQGLQKFSDWRNKRGWFSEE